MLKLRGAPNRTGEFPFAILPDLGATVVPLSQLERTRSSSLERVSFGSLALEAMCGGGPFRDSVLLVAGPTGTGKSLIGLEFLDAGDERGLLVAFGGTSATVSPHRPRSTCSCCCGTSRSTGRFTEASAS